MSVCRPWTKHIHLYISSIWDGFSFLSRFSLCLVSLVSPPPVGYLFQSYGEFVFASCITKLYSVIFTTMVITSRAFVQGKFNQSQPFCSVSWLIIQLAFPVLSVSCSITLDIWSLLMLVWEGLHWLLAGGFVSYQLRHIALRVNLEPYPGPISIIDRWPCAHHLIIIMGLWLRGFPFVRR